MQNALIVTGTLTDECTVKLDEALPMTSAKVQVIVEAAANGAAQNGVAAEAAPAPQRSHTEVIEEIWAEQKARGHVPPSAEEVHAWIEEERNSWGD